MRAARLVIPFAVSATLFAAILFLLVEHGLHQDAGTFVYPLDDAYIHLAVSRNLALHGVWGITPYGFSGASSSPGWTLLLAAATRVAGVHVLTPLLLNTAAALVLLLVAAFVLARALPQSSTAYRTAMLCLLVLVVPLPGLALIGMEHVLHSVVVLCLIAAASAVVRVPVGSNLPRGPATWMVLAAAACGALRYESCFVVAVVIVILLVRRRVGMAALVGMAAAIGPVGYGIYSYAHSHVLLPFSVVMKSADAGDPHPLGNLVSSTVSAMVLMLGVVLILRLAQRAAQLAEQREPFWSYGRTFLVIAFATTIIHAEVGPTSWLMRYEAYLYAIDVVALAIGIAEEPALFRGAEGHSLTRAQQWVGLALILAILPAATDLLHRAHHGWTDVAESMHDRYVEHLPQALFVAQQMPHAAVVANDIGFLAFYAEDAKILDPLGLGSIEPVLLHKEHRKVNPQFVAQWAAADGAKLAILHTDFPGMDAMVPSGWVLVESWCFPHNLVFQNHIESYYAPDAAAADALRSKMAQFHEFSPELVRYRYPQNGNTPPSPVRGENAVCPAPVG